jgi:hypothetical protein
MENFINYWSNDPRHGDMIAYSKIAIELVSRFSKPPTNIDKSDLRNSLNPRKRYREEASPAPRSDLGQFYGSASSSTPSICMIPASRNIAGVTMTTTPPHSAHTMAGVTLTTTATLPLIITVSPRGVLGRWHVPSVLGADSSDLSSFDKTHTQLYKKVSLCISHYDIGYFIRATLY